MYFDVLTLTEVVVELERSPVKLEFRKALNNFM